MIETTRPATSISRGYPLGALVLSLVGANLFVVEGVYLFAVGTVSGSFNDLVPSGGLLPPVPVVGVVACLEGVVAILLAALVYTSPRHHTFVGISLLTIALLALLSGGGFLLGTLLVYVGGVIAILHQLHRAPNHVPEELARAAADDPVLEADLHDAGRSPFEARAAPDRPED